MKVIKPSFIRTLKFKLCKKKITQKLDAALCTFWYAMINMIMRTVRVM